MMRYRSLFLFGGAIIAAALSFYTDPDEYGLSTMLGGLAIIQGLWAVVAAHLGRKALTDYPEADQRRLFTKAGESATGAGLALIALAIVFVGLLLVFAPRAHAETLPDGFHIYGPILKAEQLRYWPDHPDPASLYALVEHESCVSLKSPRCWNPGSKLKTNREEGAGMGQLTRAYRDDGSIRFDALADIKAQYNDELSGLSWNNIYQHPDYQLRAMVIMSRDAARTFRGTPGWLQFGDAGYNGGIAGVQKERRACKLSSGCDPSKWFDNVESHCLKSRQPLYGNRSACDINRMHVRAVFIDRRIKYVGVI